MRKVLFIFSELTDGDVEWLAKAGDRIHLETGTVLIPLGARVDYLYFVLDGRLAIKTRAGDLIAHARIGRDHRRDVARGSGAHRGVGGGRHARPRCCASPTRRCARSSPPTSASPRASTARSASSSPTACATPRMRMGYGNGDATTRTRKDELNEDLLDTVHLAGARFDRMLKRLAG